MSKIKIILILSGYQLTWLMCIFGELIYNSFLPGLIFGLGFLLLSFLNSNNKKKFTFIVLSIAIIGYIFDSILVFLKIYNFDVSLYFGFLPIWMLVLWPSFSILFDEVFVFLTNYKFLALFLSGSLGPLTYYSGVPLGLIEMNQLYLFIFLMIIFWVSLMYLYLNYLIKFKFD
tara:strand:- start:602 stop:1120 length:519 start_codon:yes stop_codon:yes gene_type:complete